MTDKVKKAELLNEWAKNPEEPKTIYTSGKIASVALGVLTMSGCVMVPTQGQGAAYGTLSLNTSDNGYGPQVTQQVRVTRPATGYVIDWGATAGNVLGGLYQAATVADAGLSLYGKTMGIIDAHERNQTINKVAEMQGTAYLAEGIGKGQYWGGQGSYYKGMGKYYEKLGDAELERARSVGRFGGGSNKVGGAERGSHRR